MGIRMLSDTEFEKDAVAARRLSKESKDATTRSIGDDIAAATDTTSHIAAAMIRSPSDDAGASGRRPAIAFASCSAGALVAVDEGDSDDSGDSEISC